MPNDGIFTLRALDGGRNGFDAPLSVPDHQCLEAVNVEWYGTSFARKRNGAAELSGLTAANSSWLSLLRHVPLEGETAAELWAFGDTPAVLTRNSGNVWSTPTLKDAITGTQVLGASLNGQFALFYDSAVSRAHVWDGATVRRMGLAMPVAAVFSANSNGGAGSVTDTRKYTFRLLEKSGSTIVRRSEASTPFGGVVLSSNQFEATVDAGSGLPDEGETHWELYGASIADGYGTYYYIGEAALGDSIIDDNADVTQAGDAEPLVGTYSLPPACKFGVATDARFVMAGAYESAVDGDNYGEITPKKNRVWWTPVIGDLDVSDSERVVMTTDVRSYLDVEEEITGLGLGEGGAIYVFGARSIWQLSPTGSPVAPYLRTTISRAVGTYAHTSIAIGEDENGRPATYFMSMRGPYRLGAYGGLEWLGNDVQDITSATDYQLSRAVAVYHADRKQVWFQIRVGADAFYTGTRLIFDVSRGQRTAGKGVVGGWSRHVGASTNVYSMVMFSDSVGATMGLPLKPYAAIASGLTLWKLDADDETDDAGSTFQAYIDTKPYQLAGPQTRFTVTNPVLLAKAEADVSVRVTMTRDFGLETSTADADLSPADSETRVSYLLEDGRMDDAEYLSFRIGDAAAASTAWTIEQLEMLVHRGARRCV